MGPGSHQGSWAHAQLTTGVITAALGQVRAFPKVSEVGENLAKLGDAIVELRTALQGAPWGVALRGETAQGPRPWGVRAGPRRRQRNGPPR